MSRQPCTLDHILAKTWKEGWIKRCLYKLTLSWNTRCHRALFLLPLALSLILMYATRLFTWHDAKADFGPLQSAVSSVFTSVAFVRPTYKKTKTSGGHPRRLSQLGFTKHACWLVPSTISEKAKMGDTADYPNAVIPVVRECGEWWKPWTYTFVNIIMLNSVDKS